MENKIETVAAFLEMSCEYLQDLNEEQLGKVITKLDRKLDIFGFSDERRSRILPAVNGLVTAVKT